MREQQIEPLPRVPFKAGTALARSAIKSTLIRAVTVKLRSISGARSIATKASGTRTPLTGASEVVLPDNTDLC